MNIFIIDYGYGNLFSLSKALTSVGASPVVSSLPDKMESFDKIIIPGVGAFGDGMRELRNRGFEKPLQKAAKNGKTILGICLGMQFLFEYGNEFGKHDGLGLTQGGVEKIVVGNDTCKIPHIGWNVLLPSEQNRTWRNTLLAGIPQKSYMYFVHSFAGKPSNKEDILALTEYCGTLITVAIQKNNIMGTQFHPEKSGKIGLSILKNFVNY